MSKSRHAAPGKPVPSAERRAERDAVVERRFRHDLSAWVDSDPRIATKVLALVEDVIRDPHAGLGKPEPLKHRRRAAWSRRITQEHRLIYEITDVAIYFLRASGHYTG